VKSLTADTQRCKPPMLSRDEVLPRAFAVPTPRLSSADMEEGRSFCATCRSLFTCRDFAYVTRMLGFVAGTTDGERADVLDQARRYVAQQRAAARTEGKPFSSVERDRVFQSAVKSVHLVKVLGGSPPVGETEVTP